MISIGLSKRLENAHSNLKWLWQLLIGLSIISTGNSLVPYLGQEHESDASPLVIFLFLGLFLATVFRFLFGNLQYIDQRYDEWTYKPLKREDLVERSLKLSGARRFFDFARLLTTGFILILLGGVLIEPAQFMLVYQALLLWNVITLLISVFWNGIVESISHGEEGLLILEWKFYLREETFPSFWVINNFVFLVLYQTLAGGSPGVLSPEYLFLAIFYANSMVDLVVARKHYFPPLEIANEAPALPISHAKLPKERISQLATEDAEKIRILQTYIPDVEPLPEGVIEHLRKGGRVELILLEPDCDASKARIAELGFENDKASSSFETLCKQLRAAGVSDENIEIRFTEQRPPFPLYAVDDAIFIGQYWPRNENLASPFLELTAEQSDYARAAVEAFDQLWEGEDLSDAKNSRYWTTNDQFTHQTDDGSRQGTP